MKALDLLRQIEDSVVAANPFNYDYANLMQDFAAIAAAPGTVNYENLSLWKGRENAERYPWLTKVLTQFEYDADKRESEVQQFYDFLAEETKDYRPADWRADDYMDLRFRSAASTAVEDINANRITIGTIENAVIQGYKPCADVDASASAGRQRRLTRRSPSPDKTYNSFFEKMKRENVRIIVSLGTAGMGEYDAFEEYWAKLTSEPVMVELESRSGKTVPALKLTLPSDAAGEVHEIIHFNIAVDDNKPFNLDETGLNLLLYVHAKIKAGERIYDHCSSGVGRAGTFNYMLSLLDALDEDETLRRHTDNLLQALETDADVEEHGTIETDLEERFNNLLHGLRTQRFAVQAPDQLRYAMRQLVTLRAAQRGYAADQIDTLRGQLELNTVTLTLVSDRKPELQLAGLVGVFPAPVISRSPPPIRRAPEEPAASVGPSLRELKDALFTLRTKGDAATVSDDSNTESSSEGSDDAGASAARPPSPGDGYGV